MGQIIRETIDVVDDERKRGRDEIEFFFLFLFSFEVAKRIRPIPAAR